MLGPGPEMGAYHGSVKLRLRKPSNTPKVSGLGVMPDPFETLKKLGLQEVNR